MTLLQDQLITLSTALTSLAALSIVAVATLRGWRGWLDLKRAELDQGASEPARLPAADRIEMADLRERIRKLEAIAEGVDL
ncbi:hypothetical protein LWE61_16965 [Sphingobium sufflavum]|uniref:hypothetical protein n=1 Tax=Sphingobium sufflavum TaxID=1129547 RepID=UPI001F3386F9|nr:hypothetical protein [Sphingobium sufflavum]MCE7798231.1 hypothetical protein [Sphingobium sufflavum]